MPEKLRPIIARLIGAAVGALASWLAIRLNAQLSHEDQVQISAGLMAVASFIFNAVYAATHKAVNSRINPADSATKELAKRGKLVQDDMRFFEARKKS